MNDNGLQSRRNGEMDLRDIRFGIEIETLGRTRADVARAIQSVVGGTGAHTGGMYDAWEVTDLRDRVWKVVTDSSIGASREFQAEVVSPILTYGDIEQLQEVVRAIRRAGARVDRSCGIHVHCDASAFDGRTLANLAKMVYKQEPLILHALGVSEARLQRYTRPLDDEFIRRVEAARPRTADELNPLWYGQRTTNPEHYHRSRYSGVNFHSYWHRNTLEFRWFQGTNHAGKVKAYIQFCLAIAAKALNSRAASSRKREFSATSAKYDFRCWLLRLGLIGDEFKTARLHLMANMPGSAAWKNGRPATANA